MPATPETTHTAFFYGTLMAPQVMRRVIYGHADNVPDFHKDTLVTRPAILYGHQRHKVRHADYPAILPTSDDSCVRGSLVSGLTDADIWRLDIFEGSEYERRSVTAHLLLEKGTLPLATDAQPKEKEAARGQEVVAETYIWTAGSHRLELEEWDFNEFVREKMGRWVGTVAGATDEGFHDVDDAVAAQQDPTGGRGANGDITRALETNMRVEEEVLKSAV